MNDNSMIIFIVLRSYFYVKSSNTVKACLFYENFIPSRVVYEMFNFSSFQRHNQPVYYNHRQSNYQNLFHKCGFAHILPPIMF